jgi:hypothetical protein
MTTYTLSFFIMAIQWLRAKARGSITFMQSPLGRFLLAQNVSELGTELDKAGLRILFIQALGQAEGLKAIGLVESVPYLFAMFLAFPLGTLAGRMTLRRAALTVNFLLGVVTLGMFGFKFVPLAVSVQVLRRCGDSFFGAVYNRAITTVAPGGALANAQQLATLSGQATKQVSLLLGASLVGYIGVGIFGLNALTFLAAAMLFASLDRPANPAPAPVLDESETAIVLQEQVTPAFWSVVAQQIEEIFLEMGVGLRYAFTHPSYLAALGLFTATQVNLAVKLAGVALLNRWGLPATNLGYYEAVAMLGEILVLVGVNLLRRRGVLLFTNSEGVVKTNHVWVASVALSLTMIGTGLAPSGQIGFVVKALEGAATIICCMYAQSALTLLVPVNLIATLSGFIELWRALTVGSASLAIGIYAGQLGASNIYIAVGTATGVMLLLAAPLLLRRRRP